MGTGWRRARNALGIKGCASVPRDVEDQRTENVGSPARELQNVDIRRLECRSAASPRVNCQAVESPRSPCQAIVSPGLGNKEDASPSETLTKSSVPSSPRSPSRLNLLRNNIRTLRSTCSICLESMKPGHGHAIFTAECSHAFHFPCIASNVRHGNLICPVCRAKWKEVPWQAPLDLQKEDVKGAASSTPRNRNANVNSRRREEEALRNAEEEQRRLDPVLRILDDSIASFRGNRQSFSQEPAVYDDDEPLDGTLRPPQTPTLDDGQQQFEFKDFGVNPAGTSDDNSNNNNNNNANGDLRKLDVTLHPEVEAVAAAKSFEKFTVLVRVKAPPSALNESSKGETGLRNSEVLDPRCRAPIDLVTVLDVSGSMSGTKLALLKRAMSFVISNLSPADRLAVVVFSSTAKRIFPLKRMVPDGQRSARRVIDRLLCTGGTNIAEGLKKGAKVLEDRRQRNPVASIMLLSDGQDTYSLSSGGIVSFSQVQPDRRIRQTGADRFGHIQIPVHAFGFGLDHDAATMHTISEESGGTFSFIQAEGLVQDAFAQCIGGLLSVVVQDVCLTISSSPGLSLKCFHAGSYETCILDDGSSGTIKLGDLYAEEERNILVEIKLPAVKSVKHMTILSAGCSYKDPVSQQIINNTNQEFLSISRPENIDASPTPVNLAVEKQRNRLRTAQAIADATTLADQGDMAAAQKILQNAKADLHSSAVSRGGQDQLSVALQAEITEIQTRMTNKQTYERSGRAFVLSAQSSHLRQRATTRGESIDNYSREYQTPSMADMVLRSQTLPQEPAITPTSAWRTAERLAKVAVLRKSCTKVSDLHGFENGGV